MAEQNAAAQPMDPKDRLWTILALGLAFLSMFVYFGNYNLADMDIWSRIAVGAAWRLEGVLLNYDRFAFTPTLDIVVDHEWGAGVIYFTLMDWFGPRSLLIWRFLAAAGALGFAMAAARRSGACWPILLIFFIPAALTILPGYGVVVRSHSFTYFFFGVFIFILEELRRASANPEMPLRKWWPAALLPPMMVVWMACHGGFVSGLGLVGVYGLVAFIEGRHRIAHILLVATTTLATLINPWGIHYWIHHMGAITLSRPNIGEWSPLPLFAWDAFFGFRILFPIVIICLALSWRQFPKSRNYAAWAMLVITAYLAFRSRRHTPFFGVAALGLATPYISAAWGEFLRRFESTGWPGKQALGALLLHGAIALVVIQVWLPTLNFNVLAPVGFYPVREIDLLEHAKAQGNAATPFRWGSYIQWRLYPDILVSMCGRYETTYQRDTFQMAMDFEYSRAPGWDRLLTTHDVDYVLLDLQTGVRQVEELVERGYQPILGTPGISLLLVREDHLPAILAAMEDFPETTIDPLDADIPRRRWPFNAP